MDGNTHYRLALKEAKGMVRSRQKRKTSRIICHHLLMMLEDDTPRQISPQQIYPRQIGPRKAYSEELFKPKSDKKSEQYSFDF